MLNLAGSSIGDGRFTEKRKATILESRTETTRYAGKALKVAGAKPSHWIQASAIGYYGNSGNQDATERSPAGNLFLSRVCMEWEKVANKQSRALGVDTFSILRLGVVLAPDAPAWKKMLLPFKVGAGGPLGSGEQWFSWVMLEDVVKMVNHLLENPSSAAGIWNGTAPGAVQQKDLATAIGKAYNRPALLPTPAWVLRLALGDMADELVLASCKAVPGAFQSERFQYFYPDLDAALSRLSSSE